MNDKPEMPIPEKEVGERAEILHEIKELKELEEEILDEIIDLEEWVKAGKHPRLARGYKIRIDKTHYTVHIRHMTGRQLLELAVKIPPEKYILRQIHPGGRPEKVGLDQTVDFAEPGIEKFKTMPCNATDGSNER
jgi:hypothetical protein